LPFPDGYIEYSTIFIILLFFTLVKLPLEVGVAQIGLGPGGVRKRYIRGTWDFQVPGKKIPRPKAGGNLPGD